MSQLELIKHELHQLIDRVDDEAVLARYLGAISSEVSGEVPDFWNDLSPQEQADILDGYEESNDETKLIPQDVIKQRYAQWLSK